MPKTIAALPLLVLAAAFAASATPPDPAEADIRRAHAEWTAAINAGDYAAPAAMGLWAPDLRGWAPGAPEDSYAREAAGLDALKRRHPPDAASRPTFAFEIVEIDVAQDLAFAHVLWTATSADGTVQPTMRSFEIWRRQADGAWRMARYLESPARP